MLKVKRWIRSLSVGIGIAAAITGCARKEMSVGRDAPSQLRRPYDARVAQATESKPPKILPATHFAAGQLFEAQGSVADAIVQYRKAVAVNHNYVEAYVRLATLHNVSGAHDEAVEAWQQAVRIDPNNAILRNNLGFELMFAKRWAEAERELRQAIALQPNLHRAQVNLGMVLTRLSRFDEAMACFRAVLPEPDAQYNMGLMYRGQRRYREAAESFRSALQANPDFSAARAQLATLPTDVNGSNDGAGPGASDSAPRIASTERPSSTTTPPDPAAAPSPQSDAPPARRLIAESPVAAAPPAQRATTAGAKPRVDNAETVTTAESPTDFDEPSDWDSMLDDPATFVAVVENEMNCIEEERDERAAMEEEAPAIVEDALTAASLAVRIDASDGAFDWIGASPVDFVSFADATRPGDELEQPADEAGSQLVDTSPADWPLDRLDGRMAGTASALDRIAPTNPEPAATEIAFGELAELLAILDNEAECLAAEALAEATPEAYDVPVDLVGERRFADRTEREFDDEYRASGERRRANVVRYEAMATYRHRRDVEPRRETRTLATLAHQLSAIRNEIGCLEEKDAIRVMAVQPFEHACDAGLVPYRATGEWVDDSDDVAGPPMELAPLFHVDRARPKEAQRERKPRLVKEKIPPAQSIKPPPKPITDARDAGDDRGATRARSDRRTDPRDLRSNADRGRNPMRRRSWSALFGELESLAASARNEVFGWAQLRDSFDDPFGTSFDGDRSSVLFVAPTALRDGSNRSPAPLSRDASRRASTVIPLAVEPPDGPPALGHPSDRHPR